MRKALRRRFWAEGVLAVVTAVLILVTLAQRDWIEGVFGIDPDSGNGSVEWLIVAALAVATMTMLVLAGYEVRRTVTALA